ncbi:MAG TPA: glutathione S-transferase family protein [Caulobacteraceae bacterium]|jgi:glutathione S-transferase
MSDITLYFARATRAFVPLWLLEELGLPYRLKRLNLKRGDQKTRPYVALNPMGKVPTLTDGQAVLTENPAICLYLADRYGYGTFAPLIEAPGRAAYLRWTVFATAVAEPSIYADEPQDPIAASSRGWGDKASVISALKQALTPRPWLLGETFSAADVMLGSLLSIALFNKRIPEPPEEFVAYVARLGERPAFRRAAEMTWGEEERRDPAGGA